MKKFLFLPLLFLLFCCSEDSPTEPTSPFAGAWDLVFAGSAVGAGSMDINNDGSFNLNVLLMDGNGDTFMNNVRGSVADNGDMEGDIYYAGDDIGDVSGKLSGSSGSGTWVTSVTAGTWGMVKQ